VRVLASFALVITGLTATAHADRAEYGYDNRRAENTEFWRDVAEPHADEVRMVLDKIEQAYQVVLQNNNADNDVDGALRTRLLDDARGMAKYLRRLVPDNVEVMLAMGKIADEAGRADEALEALLAYLDAVPDSPAYEATVRVGRIYLHMKKYDDAIRYLRLANMAGSYYNNYAAIYLANALAGSGRDEEALDVLQAAAETPGSSWGGEPQLPMFALAVAYDRDEQISEAFASLDRLQNSMQGGYLGQMQSAIDGFIPAPAAEAHYYRALLYESSGFLDEARSSWVLYAQSGEDARYKDRALSHVAAIDVLIDKTIAGRKPGKKGAAAAVTVAPYGGYGGAYGGYGGGYGYGSSYGGYGGGYTYGQPAATTTPTKKKIKKKKKKKKAASGSTSP
jgi:tetratricopeptide (TPR) repeat protein